MPHRADDVAAAGPVVRPASPDDLDALLAIEERAFETDRLSRRSFRHFLTRGQASCVVVEAGGRVAGYALVLYRRATALARLYSIALDPGMRGQGLAGLLMEAAERAAADAGCLVLRLEVRLDNAPAIALYRARGYRRFGRYLDYYEDHADALRLQKVLRASVPDHVTRVPYYGQTTDFTCGAAALLMVMRALDPNAELSRRQELRLWREANTVFMMDGTGGCEPYGLAVALARRGFAAEVLVTAGGALFLDTVRSPVKREVMALVQEDFRAEAARLGIPVHRRALTIERLSRLLGAGGVAIVLISSYRMYHAKTPHWVVVHGCDGRYVFVHDPWIEDEDLETPMAKADLPIPLAEFMRMARFGRDRLQAAVLVRASRRRGTLVRASRRAGGDAP